MLKKPYKLFHTRENNNYYFLQVNEIQYLAIESVLRYKKQTFFGSKNVELQQALKVLPIYSPILLTISRVIQLNPIGKQTIEDVGEEIIYDKVNIKGVREKIAELTDSVHDEAKFDFGRAIKCVTVKKIMEENELELLMKQKIDSLVSIYWLAKSDKFGKLTIQEITTFGRTDEKFMSANTYVLDRNLIETILIELKRIQLEQDKKRLKEMKKELKMMKKQSKNLEEIKENEESE